MQKFNGMHHMPFYVMTETKQTLYLTLIDRIIDLRNLLMYKELPICIIMNHHYSEDLASLF